METNIIKIPEVERVFIEDFGVIEKADINFSPGLNLIVGKNGSGKTTVINYMIKISDPNLMAAGNKIMFDINEEIDKNCILIDDILCRLDNEKLIKILKNLETCNRQVIATLNISRLDDIKNKVKANIINTENFELKEESNN